MSLDALKQVLDQIDEHACCEGTYKLEERLAIALPDGDVGAADDPRFVDWLLEHSEPAPFGEANQTKIDPKVRRAQRLTARDKASVAGFDPEAILGEIEAKLSPRCHLTAQLTDVIVYPRDGKFARHKDTPRSPELVGTLVVAAPIAHEGGAFQVDDGRGAKVFDWSGTPDPKAVRWVALFGDVDHEVRPVTAGARVTLVYALLQTEKPRTDPVWVAQQAKLKQAGERLAAAQTEWPIMIACTRHVITDSAKQPQAIKTLRGVDRDVAEGLKAAGLSVVVRSCIAASPTTEGEPAAFPDTQELWSVTRLAKPLTPKVIASLDDIVTFTDDASADDEEDLSAFSLAAYVLDEVPIERWVIRDNAKATMIHEALFSDSGYFGNEAYQAYLYTLAALEVEPKRGT